jgi:hypothetical protein
LTFYKKIFYNLYYKMSISLTRSLTVPKVSQDYAANVQSARFQNPSQGIYPAFNGQDLMGRPANHNTFKTLTAGVSHPLARIYVENSLRPSYDVYLNMSGIEGDNQASVPSFGGYDTQGLSRSQPSMNGSYQVPTVDPSAGYAVRSENEIAKINSALRRKNQAMRFSNMKH